MAIRFLYRAYGIGISGKITRPVDKPIESQANSALPPAGGYSSARQDRYQLLEILSHGGTVSEATGSDNPTTGDHETSVTATVQNLNIGNVLLADSFTAHLTSRHPASGGPPKIIPQGSFFDNLQIAGRKIELESRVDEYGKLDTLEQLRQHYKADAGFRDRFLKEAYVGNESALHHKQHKYFPWRNVKNTAELPVSNATEVTIVPLFIVLNRSAPGFQVNGNTITVENFGTIVLGELVIGGYERRLTMLHVDLGSPTEGTVSCCSVVGNGTTTDPP